MVKNRDSDPVLRCSTVCTRAGLAALTFSVLAFSLVEPLEKAGDTAALLEYLYLRVALSATIHDFDPAKCWKNQSWNSIGDLALSSLIKESCDVKSESKRSRMDDNRKDIERYLKELNKHRRLERARIANYHQYDESIYNWVNHKTKLIGPIDNKRREVSATKTEPLSDAKRLVSATRTFPGSPGLVPHYKESEVLDRLTFSKVKQLVGTGDQQDDLPKIEQTLANAEKLALPWAAGPVDVVSVSIITELGLLFSVICFGLYLREGQRIQSISYQSGTLFSVFKATTTSQLIFGVLVLVPVVASIWVAYKSSFGASLNLYIALFVIVFSFPIMSQSQRGMIVKGCFLALLVLITLFHIKVYVGPHALQSIKEQQKKIESCGESGFDLVKWQCHEDDTDS